VRGVRAAAILLVFLAAGCGGTQQQRSHTTPAPTRAMEVDRLSLRQQVGEVLVLAFGGTEAPEYVRRALREGRVSGAILFGGNVASPAQLRALTASLQRASGRRALVMTDQEGGTFHIVPWAAPHTGQAAQASPDAAGAAARAAAKDLRAAGVNVTLAPVADVGRPGSALAARTFPGGPAQVGTAVAAAVRAYRAGGVAATAKHFPGMGAAADNTDDAPASMPLTRADLAPFRSAIAAGVPLIMASHATYPNVDRARLASQSPVILRDLLRERMRFRGVVITDSIEARAVLSRSSVTVAAQRALAAGADLVLMTGDGSFRPVSQAFLRRARRDARFRARVREAAARVLELKRALGLRPAAR
jgi:beta-N-acetylhexosaminidase